MRDRLQLSRILMGVAVALGSTGPACADGEPFTLELIVNDESALALSVDRGTIEPANATFLRVYVTWESYDEALAHPGATLANDADSLTIRVRDCEELEQGQDSLGTIVHQLQNAAVAVDGQLTLARTAGWECTDSRGVSVGIVP